MTVETTTLRHDYTASSGQTVFTFTFRIFNDSDLKVYVDDVLKELGADYTVSINSDPNTGGTVTLNTPLNGGEKVVLLRQVPQKQQLDYTSFGKFPADSHEAGLDRVVVLVQQLQEQINRALTYKETSVNTGLTVPDPQANYFLRWKADLSGLENMDIANQGALSVSAFIKTLLDDQDATTARGTLSAAGKVSGATADNLAKLDSSGDLADAGFSIIKRSSGELVLPSPVEGPGPNWSTFGVGSVYVMRDMAQWSSNSPLFYGTVKITLPGLWTDAMLLLRLVGQDYSTNEWFELHFGGKPSAGTSSWDRAFAKVYGDGAPFDRVRFGHDGTNACVLLGTASTAWRSPQLALVEALLKTAAAQTYTSGPWSISLIPNESGITVQQTKYVNASGVQTIILKHVEPSSTPGGSATGGVWNVRTVNTIALDETGQVTLSTNQFSLPAGVYEVDVAAHAHRLDRHMLCLANITDSVVTLYGMAHYTSNPGSVSNTAIMRGRLSISGTRTFEIRHYAQTSQATNGFGVQANIPGTSNTFLTAIFRRVRSA